MIFYQREKKNKKEKESKCVVVVLFLHNFFKKILGLADVALVTAGSGQVRPCLRCL